MKSFYISENTLFQISSPSKGLAEYIFSEEESLEKYPPIHNDMNWVIESISGVLDIKGDIKFAIVASIKPYQVTITTDNTFVVLIDHRAYYLLLTLCIRFQSLPPICDLLGVDEIPESRDYKNKFLLDITKDIVFHRHDLSDLQASFKVKQVYQSALIYIVSHEIAHIAHGHLEFIQSADYADFKIDEADENLTLRTLEMDADSSATTSTFDIFERIANYYITSGRYAHKVDEPSFLLMVRRQYITGIYVAHLYLDTLASNFSTKKHPITYARFLTSKNILGIVFFQRAKEAIELPEQIRIAISNTFVNLSGHLNYLGHPIAANIEILDVATETVESAYDLMGEHAGLSHIEPLHGRWARLRPYLEKYHRGGKLAPASADPY